MTVLYITLFFSFNTIKWGRRNYTHDVEKSPLPVRASVTPLPPLSEPMPSLPPVTFSTAKAEDTLTEVTVLSNGLKIASEKKFGQFCTAGGKFQLNYVLITIFNICSS